MGDLRFLFYFLTLQQSLKLGTMEISGYDVDNEMEGHVLCLFFGFF